MRTSTIVMLIAGLALWAGQALAQPSQPLYSADGLYNLGNSYARAGKPGLAVLSYERAALLAPNDPDINANLAYVRASAHVFMKPRSRFARLAQAASPTLAAWLGVLGIALVGIGLVARKVAPRFLWMPGGGILLGVALIALSVVQRDAAVATNARGGRPRRPDTRTRIPGTDGRHGICIAGSGERHDDGGA